MKRRLCIYAIIVAAYACSPLPAVANDSGLFRIVPVDTPEKGTLRVSNTSFFAPITANSILKTTYGVNDSDVMSSLTHASLGLTDRIALTGTIPFYADLFTQGSRSGEKTGPGDVGVGLRMAFGSNNNSVSGYTIGAGVVIPEEMSYGNEPLGFRTFSTGEFAYNADLSLGFGMKWLDGYLTASYRGFVNAPKSGPALSSDVFYESAYGYLGIGAPNAQGKASVIFQDHVTITAGAAVPFKTWLAGLLEVQRTSFSGSPSRDMILRLAPGVRLGRAGGFHVATGIDFKLHGDVPVRSYMFKLAIPFFRPVDLITRPLGREPAPENLVRSRNSLVAVNDFTLSDSRWLYEDELKHAFLNDLSSMGIMDLVDEERVDASFERMRLVPKKDTPERTGIRLGSNYLINTDITEYTVSRHSSFSIPYVIRFPKTTFALSASASVTDLVTGKTYNLGVISSEVIRSRGVNFFAHGVSSDLEYLSEPERRDREKELVERWIEDFNGVIIDNLDVFGWQPKRTEIRGDEETSG